MTWNADVQKGAPEFFPCEFQHGLPREFGGRQELKIFDGEGEGDAFCRCCASVSLIPRKKFDPYNFYAL